MSIEKMIIEDAREYCHLHICKECPLRLNFNENSYKFICGFPALENYLTKKEKENENE